MADYGLAVYDSAGNEVVFGARPLNVVKRITVNPVHSSSIQVPMPELPTSTSITLVAGLLGGTTSEAYGSSGFSDWLMSSYTYDATNNRVTINYIANPYGSPDNLVKYYTIVANRGNVGVINL